MKNELESPLLSQQSTNIMNNLSFRATFSYRLGKITAEPTRRRKKSVNNDDLKGGGEGGGQEAGGGAPAAGGAPASAPGGTPGPGQMQRPGGGAPGQTPAGGPGQFQRPAGAPGIQQPGVPNTQTPTTTTDSTSAQPAATSVSNGAPGAWQGRMGQFDLTLKLVAEGETLTGTVTTPRGESPITEGKISGNNLTFNVTFGPNAIPYQGVIEGDNLKITATFQGQPMEAVFNRVK